MTRPRTPSVQSVRENRTEPPAPAALCPGHTPRLQLLTAAWRWPRPSVVDERVKPCGNDSLPVSFDEGAALKPRPTERRLALRWPQRGVPRRALETRHRGSGRMKHRWCLAFTRDGRRTHLCPRWTRTVARIVEVCT